MSYPFICCMPSKAETMCGAHRLCGNGMEHAGNAQIRAVKGIKLVLIRISRIVWEEVSGRLTYCLHGQR